MRVLKMTDSAWPHHNDGCQPSDETYDSSTVRCVQTLTQKVTRETERANNTGVCKLADQVASNRSPNYATSQGRLGQIQRPL